MSRESTGSPHDDRPFDRVLRLELPANAELVLQLLIRDTQLRRAAAMEQPIASKERDGNE